MAKKVVWTKRASNKFDKVVEYLQTDWNENVVRAFVQRTETILELLSENPELGTVENSEKGVYGFRLTKHNRMFYRIDEERLIVLNIFDNRQSSKRKRY